MENKKKIILSVLVVLLLLAIGVTYAFFTYENGERSEIVTGQIYMNYEETSTISLTGVFPETKAQALARNDENGVFEFTITGRNTSKYPVYYEIDLLEGGVVTGATAQSTRILPEHVRIYLERDGEVLVDGMTYADWNNRRIYVDTVPANQATNIEHNYTLRMWIDENVTISDTDPNADYTTSEWNGSYASLKVRVVGDFEEKEMLLPLSEVVKSRLGNDGVVAISKTGELYEGTGEIREYRYSGSSRYCTYTNEENTYQLNVEGDICPNACMLQGTIINGNSEVFTLMGGMCADMGEVVLIPNETTPLDGDVKNYVMFNDELWRIIGVFEEETSDGTMQELVKIIRDEPIRSDEYLDLEYTYAGNTYTLKAETPNGLTYGYYYWNNANFDQINENDWSKAGVQYYLNDKMGGANSYYNSLTNEAKEMIAEVMYYLGNVDYDSNISDAYNQEHLKKCPNDFCVHDGNHETWNGKIGLMYPSDYGYASNSSNWSLAMQDYYSLTAGTGSQDNWINDSIRFAEWMISPCDAYSFAAWSIDFNGGVFDYNVDGSRAICPVLYLKSNTMVSGGDGSYQTPYELQ